MFSENWQRDVDKSLDQLLIALASAVGHHRLDVLPRVIFFQDLRGANTPPR